MIDDATSLQLAQLGATLVRMLDDADAGIVRGPCGFVHTPVGGNAARCPACRKLVVFGTHTCPACGFVVSCCGL